MTAAAPPADDDWVDQKVPVDPAELFFDLAFVFALARLVGFLHEELTTTTILEALVLFALLWWAWSQFTWAANAVGSSRRGVRVVILAATVATLPMGAALPQAFGDAGVVFALTWGVLVVAALVVYLIGVRRDPAHRDAVRRFSQRSLPGLLVVVVGAAVTAPSARMALWGLGFVALVAAAAVGGADEGWRITSSHFAERHGLFVIVALGETIVAVGVGVAGRGNDPGVVASLVAGGLLATLLWWTYFDQTAPRAEARLHLTVHSARGPVARDLYTYLHLPVTAGIVLVAVTLEEVVAHPEDVLTLALRTVLAVGLGLFLGGTILIDLRATGSLLPERLVALVGLVVLALVAAESSGFSLVAMVDAVVAVMLLVEHQRGRAG